MIKLKKISIENIKNQSAMKWKNLKFGITGNRIDVPISYRYSVYGAYPKIMDNSLRDSLVRDIQGNIQKNIFYLVKIDDVWHVGTFNDHWYGLDFDSECETFQLGGRNNQWDQFNFQELYAILDDTHDNLEIDSEKIDPELDAIFNI
jgi:hypothetical protein